MSKEKNMELWNGLRAVPAEAKKKIQGGRLKGLTDIKPQWRLQMMTEMFGPIGFGWYYETLKTWTESYDTEISAHVMINLYVKIGGEWSKPISGTGGSMLVANEIVKDYEKGLFDTPFKQYHSDEAYKMATTDALSVAMKQLGVAADVYMGLSDSKYDKKPEHTPTSEQPEVKKATVQQKATLKDYVVRLEVIGSEASGRAITAITTALGQPDASFEDIAHLINRVKKTIEKES